MSKRKALTNYAKEKGKESILDIIKPNPDAQELQPGEKLPMEVGRTAELNRRSIVENIRALKDDPRGFIEEQKTGFGDNKASFERVIDDKKAKVNKYVSPETQETVLSMGTRGILAKGGSLMTRIEAEQEIKKLKKKIKSLKKKEGDFAHRGAWNNFRREKIRPLEERVIKISNDINTGNLKYAKGGSINEMRDYIQDLAETTDGEGLRQIAMSLEVEYNYGDYDADDEDDQDELYDEVEKAIKEASKSQLEEAHSMLEEEYAKGGTVDKELLEVWKKHVGENHEEWENKDEWFDEAYDIASNYNDDKGVDEDDITELFHDQAYELLDHYGIRYAKGGSIKDKKGRVILRNYKQGDRFRDKYGEIKLLDKYDEDTWVVRRFRENGSIAGEVNMSEYNLDKTKKVFAKGGEIHSYPQKQINNLFGEKSEIKWKHRHPDRWKTYYDIWEELNENARKKLLGRKEVNKEDLEKISKIDYRNVDKKNLTKNEVLAWNYFVRYAYSANDIKKYNKAKKEDYAKGGEIDKPILEITAYDETLMDVTALLRIHNIKLDKNIELPKKGYANLRYRGEDEILIYVDLRDFSNQNEIVKDFTKLSKEEIEGVYLTYRPYADWVWENSHIDYKKGGQVKEKYVIVYTNDSINPIVYGPYSSVKKADLDIKKMKENSEYDYSEEYHIQTLDKYEAPSSRSWYKKGGLTSKKARKMLKDGMAQGKPLTNKQKRYFGALAAGKEDEIRKRARMKRGGKVSVDKFMPILPLSQKHSIKKDIAFLENELAKTNDILRHTAIGIMLNSKKKSLNK